MAALVVRLLTGDRAAGLRRVLPGLITLALPFGLLATPAHGADVGDFNAPLLGTTAVQQASRLPQADDITCGARCSTGLLPGPVTLNGPATFIPAGPASWGLLADDPALVGKIGSFYQSGDTYAGVTIIELLPGTPSEAVMKSLIKGERTSLGAPGLKFASTEIQPDGWTLWLTNIVDNPNYPGSRVRAAYATRGNEIVRVWCDGAPPSKSKLCGGIAATGLAIARTAPAPSIDVGSGSLMLAGTTPGLRPLFQKSGDSAGIWAITKPSKGMRASLGPSTLALEWGVPSQPRLSVHALTTTLASQKELRGFLATLCPKGDKSCKARSDLAPTPLGGQSAGTEIFQEGSTKVIGVELQAGDDRFLLDVVCEAPGGRVLSTAEKRACAQAISEVSQARFE